MISRSCSVRAHTRKPPRKPVEYMAMHLSLASELGRQCPVHIEPMTMDQVIEAALALDIAEFGEE